MHGKVILDLIIVKISIFFIPHNQFPIKTHRAQITVSWLKDPLCILHICTGPTYDLFLHTHLMIFGVVYLSLLVYEKYTFFSDHISHNFPTAKPELKQRFRHKYIHPILSDRPDHIWA